ncbi:MAG: hypothetical protein ACRD3Q_01210 [Terriglobales bacterium]
MFEKMLRVSCVALLLCPAIWAQQSGLPDPLSGKSMQPVLGGESKTQNILTTTVHVSTEVDDNALNASTNKVTDSISRFDPTFAWDVSRTRWSFDGSYTPGFSYSVELPRYRNFSNATQESMNVRLAKHLSLRLQNNFIRTSDPFDRLTFGQNEQDVSVLDRTNLSYLGRPTLYTRNQSGLDLTYMPAAHTTVGISGNYAMTLYDDLLAGAGSNRDTHMASGRVFVDQKLSPRQSVSAAYSYSVITSGVYGRTAVDSILLFDNWQLKSKLTLSLFAGPEYTVMHLGSTLSPIPLSSGWSWSAGGTFGWQGDMTGASFSAVRRVSDGGGLGGAVQLTDLSAALTRRMSKKWQTEFHVNYAINGSNEYSALSRSINYMSSGVRVTRQITEKISLDAQYNYTHTDKTYSGAIPSYFLADHNRVSVGVSYAFSNRLGL